MSKKLLIILATLSATFGSTVMAQQMATTSGFSFEEEDFVPTSNNLDNVTIKSVTENGVTNGDQALLFTIDKGLLPKGEYSTTASTKLVFEAPESGWQINDVFSVDFYNPGTTGIQIRAFFTDKSGTTAMYYLTVSPKLSHTFKLTQDLFKKQPDLWVAETPIGLTQKDLDVKNIQSISFGLYELANKPGDGFIIDNMYGVSGEGTTAYDIPKKDLTYGVRVDNNPANEVLIENPEYLPLTDPNNHRDWKMSEMFSDEFNGEELDTTKWSGYHRFWAGRQPSIFDPKNVSMRDGLLVLTSTWEDELTDLMIAANKKLSPGSAIYENISASAVQSIEPTGYGYYEIRAKTAPISIASAFWFRDPKVSKQEIDIFEQVGRPINANRLNLNGSSYPMNTHWFQEGTDISNGTIYNTGVDLTADFHIYGFEWDTYFLRFYIDGALVHEIDNSIDYKMDGSQYLLFDMETNIYGSNPPLKEHFDYEPGERNPADYEIDYVRVWRSDVPQSSKAQVPASRDKLDLPTAKAKAGIK
ncbi:MAG: hypothetical protein ATN31_04330 [Candidatus Epulonipiscioides saccharophilum]|nr:MAG: hypothetical protein ATN31_04330 [Epulopiscium sp. AS2M-Bin001]